MKDSIDIHYLKDNNKNSIIVTEKVMEWKRVNFVFYCVAFVLYGSMITAMGPIIPFFADETGLPETHFSFVFFSRAIGYIVGGMIAKFLVERYKLHHILTGATLVGGISFMLSVRSLSFMNLTITLFIGSACCIIMNVICNVCTMKVFRGEEGFWIQLLHTLFGIGGLVGPFLVSIFGSRSYFVLGLLMAIISVSYLFLTNPDEGHDGRVTEIARPISYKMEAIICILYVLYIGQEVGFGSWVSSYAVIEGVANLEEAAYASEVFWVTNTVFRIILIYVTIKVSLRLKILLIGMICGCLINYFAAICGYEWFAAFIGSFLNGAFLASMYALFLDLPNEFGYKLSKQNTANFMMSSSLGEGVLGMPIGYAMGIFGPSALFFFELFFAILSYIFFASLLRIFEREAKQTYLTSQDKEIEVSDGILTSV